jgi:hypothetical protein
LNRPGGTPKDAADRPITGVIEAGNEQHRP